MGRPDPGAAAAAAAGTPCGASSRAVVLGRADRRQGGGLGHQRAGGRRRGRRPCAGEGGLRLRAGR
eukprot:10940775-Lingulodinium_polyedra.AAC.1